MAIGIIPFPRAMGAYLGYSVLLAGGAVSGTLISVDPKSELQRSDDSLRRRAAPS